ncbi:alpha-ribazole phosphatase [Echinicola jeungdonensis]|uniref:Alpha-ribazole phosphatase n=1 Tax=Echinicola jeungdonensis TaxID=709343 RepID=A0ABV5J5L1_9BACT|nr:alpha-ribazole phosphatase [Echinicola jeungdonensis]MDN3671033.1 alpha-ribazole phosphatase [Echinicola jeungdonensis]
MEIYLIRHTSPKVAKGICYGQSDLPLTETFHDEVECIKKELEGLEGEYKVYSSPLLRCHSLANALFSQVPILDRRLMELNFGDWEMQAWDDIPESQLKPWMEDFVHVPCPQGESYMDLYNRCLGFLKDLKSHGHDRAIIISHGGPIRAIHAYVNGIELKDSFEFKVGFGDIVKMTI